VPQPLDRLADGLVGQAARGQPLLERDIGEQVEGPGAPGLAEPARGLVEDAPERVGLRLTEDRWHVLGSAPLLAQTAHPLLLEGVEGVVNGADGATDLGGDPGRSLAVGAGQEDLGAAEGERLAAPEARLEFPALGAGQLPNEQGWFHDPLFGANHPLPSNRMRIHEGTFPDRSRSRAFG
jgi:hypothetical protein